MGEPPAKPKLKAELSNSLQNDDKDTANRDGRKKTKPPPKDGTKTKPRKDSTRPMPVKPNPKEEISNSLPNAPPKSKKGEEKEKSSATSSKNKQPRPASPNSTQVSEKNEIGETISSSSKESKKSKEREETKATTSSNKQKQTSPNSKRRTSEVSGKSEIDESSTTAQTRRDSQETRRDSQGTTRRDSQGNETEKDERRDSITNSKQAKRDSLDSTKGGSLNSEHEKEDRVAPMLSDDDNYFKDYYVKKRGRSHSRSRSTSRSSSVTSGLSSEVDNEDTWAIDSVNVAVRVRPNPVEPTNGVEAPSCLQFPGDGTVFADSGPTSKSFTFNVMFEPEATQEDLFEHCGITKLIEMAMNGYACTCFAFGQTGSGKTHTITGPPELFKEDMKEGMDTDQHGLIPRSFIYLFKQMRNRPSTNVRITASYLEIYNEQVVDLLNPTHHGYLQVRWNKNRGFYVENLFAVECETVDDLMAVLEEGLRNRATGSNSINEHSSRSHSMLTLHIDSDEQEVEDDNLYVTKHGKLTFVDLAGSEKYEPRPDQQKSTSHLLESNNINRSLLVLGNCISALGDPRKRGGHIPYRDSKLTKLLADSLSGGGVTLMIACISPGMANASESMNTLRYANRAKHIKTKPVVKMDPREKLILTLKREIKVLRQENHYLRQQLEFPVKPRGQLQKENDEKFMKLLQDHKKADPSGKVTDHGLYEMLQEYMIENEILRGENSDLHQIRDHSRREQQVLARENEHLQRKVESIQKEHQELQTPLSQYSTGTASTHISLPKSGFKSGNDSATSILSQRSSHQQALYQAGGPPLTHRDGPPMGPSYQPAATGFTGQIPNGYIGQMPSGYVGQSPNGYVAGQVPQNGYNMGFIPQTNGYTMGQMAAQMPAAGSPRSSGHYTPGGSKKPPHHLPDSIKNSPATYPVVRYLDNSPRGSLSQPPSQASSYSQKLRQPDPPPGYSQRFQQQQQQLQQQQSPSSSQRPSIDSGSLPGSQRASLDMGPPPPLRREPQQQPVQRTSRVSSVNPTQAEDDELESVTDLNERLRRELLDLEGQIQHEHRAPGGGYPSPRHAPWGVGGFPQQPPPGHATMGGPGGGGSPPKPTPRAGQNSGWR